MSILKKIAAILAVLTASHQAFAFYTELGASYVYKTTFVDNLNNMQTQGVTGSISLYFWERVALELSYTNSQMVKSEQAVSAASASTLNTIENDTIYGTDFIFMFADHKAVLQPYLKAGVGYVTKRQLSQIDNNPPWQVGPYSGWSPDYGAGVKIMLGESFSLRMGYDVQITPVANNSTAQDINGHAGISWVL